MLKTLLRLVLPALVAASLTACGSGHTASALPQAAIRETRSVASTGSGPSVVQYYTYQTAASSTETSSTVTLGTSGSAGRAPASGDLLVVLIGYADTGNGATITVPSGFAAASGGALSNKWAHQAVYTESVGSSAPASLTFSWSEPVSTQIRVVEVAGSAGIDTITSATGNPKGSPWDTSTGTGTQAGLDDLGLVFVSVADAILSADTLSGYAQLGSTLGNHGNGTTSWGSTSAVYQTNAPIATASVPAQTVGWTAGSGTEAVLGEQVLLRPGAGASADPAPTVAAGSGGAPSVVQEFSGQTAAHSSAPTASVTLGTSGSAGRAPASGDMLVALVGYADTGSGATITPPSGFTAVASGALSNAFAHQAVYTSTVSGSAPSSATFGFSELVSAQIWIVEVANASSVDVVTSATGNPAASPWNTTTGRGTQSGLDDVGLVFVSITDAILSANPVSGYTQLGTTLGNHGDGTSSYGATSAAYRSNSPLTSASVPSVTVGWTAGDGTEAVLGEQVLLRAGSGAGAAPAQAPTSDPAPTAAPTATAVAGCPAAPTLTPGYEYAAGWAPFCDSPWTTPISSNPTIASWSQTVINNTWQNGNQCEGECEVEAPGNGDLYYAKSSDPAVTLKCTGGSGYCDTGDNGGYPSTISLPAVARPGSGCMNDAGGSTDDTMQVIQPNGTDVEIAYAQGCGSGSGGNWVSGNTLTVGAAASCGNWAGTEPGFLQQGVGSSASGRCFTEGMLRADEIAAGSIDHALAITELCGGSPGGSTWQYPASPGASTNGCTGGAAYGPPLGGRLWWDESCTTMSSVGGFTPTEIAIFCALDKYGAYFTDDVGGATAALGFGVFTTESQYMFSGYGTTWPYSQLSDWSSYGNCPNNPDTGTCYYLTSHNTGGLEWDPFGHGPSIDGVTDHVGTGDALDPLKHFHWLSACSAENQC